uniref:Transmembrane emp24 domain-containing protein 1-like n=1 Tax=Phallusia mammillata TaxID=59560 RepID=A0A6F9DV62_9ASCI|nr:transmembrane emp24 domain-containing protein 1-like [Phallusia mammillata]
MCLKNISMNFWKFFMILLNVTWLVHAYRDNDLTVEISAGRKECFYQPTKTGQSLEIEYQVIDGGDLDIDFRVSGPNGNPIVTEFRRNDGIHTIETTQEGDYEVCFDNTFSRMTSKSVFFELILDNAGDIDELEDEEGEWKKFVSQDENIGDALASLEVAGETLSQIKNNNARTIQFQAMLRALEAKDRHIAETNFVKINTWSIANIVIMTLVFALQIFMVRNMFNDKKKVRT